MRSALVDVLHQMAPRYVQPHNLPQESVAVRIVEYLAYAAVREFRGAFAAAQHIAILPLDMRQLILRHVNVVSWYWHSFGAGSWKYGVYTGSTHNNISRFYKRGRLLKVAGACPGPIDGKLDYKITLYNNGYAARTLFFPLRRGELICVEHYYAGCALLGFTRRFHSGEVISTYLTEPMTHISDYFNMRYLPVVDRLAIAMRK